MGYMNSSFFIPVWFENFDTFASFMELDCRWADVDPEELAPRYLLNYAVRIAKNPRLFRAFRLKNTEGLNLYMGEGRTVIPAFPELTEIRMSCFSTGVGFLEFRVAFRESTPENVADFSYIFKKAAQRRPLAEEHGKRVLFDVATDLMPEGTSPQLFFTASAEFKFECISYHRLKMDFPKPDDGILTRWLSLLKRSYGTGFRQAPRDSEYDFHYEPYEYDHWAGCPEGMVDLLFASGDEKTDKFLDGYKRDQLDRDYYFLYLVLLNQRFSAIQYVTMISAASAESSREVELLNRRIVELKAVFAFNIVSDDQLFQNLYAKMYKILDIDRLLDDVRDNESQMEMIHSKIAERSEKLSNRLLFGISLLSVFSAMLDASDFFERFDVGAGFSTGLGMIFALVIMGICVSGLVFRRRK